MAVLRTESSAANLCTNGGFEADTTGWSVAGDAVYLDNGGTLTRVTSTSKFGAASANLIAASGVQGCKFAFTGAATTTYTLSAWINGSGVLTAVMGETDGDTIASDTWTPTAAWARYTLAFTTSADTALTFAIRRSSGSVDVYIDGVRVEAAPTATPNVEALVPARSRFARLAA